MGVWLIVGLIRQPRHWAQRMGLGNPLLMGYVREQGAGVILLAAHPVSAFGPSSREWT